jgi:hypothetical protein
MTAKKRKHVDTHVDVGATLSSQRIVVRNKGARAAVYVPMPDEYQRRTRELAREWQCSEWEAINIIWKCGNNPHREGESDIAYFKRIENLPDAPAFYVQSMK